MAFEVLVRGQCIYYAHEKHEAVGIRAMATRAIKAYTGEKDIDYWDLDIKEVK